MDVDDFKHNRSYIKCLLVMIGLISMMMVETIALSTATRADGLPPMTLTVVALNGTQVVLHESDIGSLPAVTAVGGFRNQIGIVKEMGNYTGPSLDTLLNLVGGMTSNNSLRVTAADNYTGTFSYDMVNGAFQTYDHTTGNPVPHYQSLTPILAYYFNDTNLPTGEGPLRLAIVGPEGLATFSQYWVKMVVKLEIRYIDDVATTSVVPLKTVIGQGYPCNVTATAANQGGYDETFNAIAYSNQTTIGTHNVTLSAGNSTTILFNWDTTGFVYGNYTLSAYTSPVPGETNTTNNNCTSNVPLHIGVPGDVSSTTSGMYDGITNMKDIAYLISLFNTKPSSPTWNPNADINNDGIVNMKDIAIAIAYFNKHE